MNDATKEAERIVLEWDRLLRANKVFITSNYLHDLIKRISAAWPVAQPQRCEHGVLWNMECLTCGHSDFEPAHPAESQGYKRRLCSKCGEGLGFNWQGPLCERCDGEDESQSGERVCVKCGHSSNRYSNKEPCTTYRRDIQAECGCKCEFTAGEKEDKLL